MSRLRAFAIATLVSMGAFGAAGAAGLRVNTTHSIPPGVYWLTDRPVVTGAIVLACPPQMNAIAEAFTRGYIDAGFCPGGYESLFKRIAAAKGDRVSVDADGVTVNGHRLPHTVPIDADPAGRPLPHYRIDNLRLPSGEVFLIASNSPLSFDARYFGPVDRSLVRGVVVPIFTW